ncbi:MAG: hypothetical protein AB7K68_16285 [Bacteriovoracia bacterium]
MKTILFIFSAMLMQPALSWAGCNPCVCGPGNGQPIDEVGCKGVQPSQVLYCQGGPGAASAILELYPASGNQRIAKMTLKNAAFPRGIRGTYELYQGSSKSSYGNGVLGALDSNIIFTPPNHLSVYAQGNYDIEFGYGVHFICQ